jgi:hypothetical protein
METTKTLHIVFTLLLISAAGAAQGDIVATGKFQGAAHKTTGRATIYSVNRKQTLRLTGFKTSNGPNVHVVLVAATDAPDDENFLNKNIERVDLGRL